MNQDLNIDTLLDELATQISRQIEQGKLVNYQIVGIRTGGVWVAEALKKTLGLSNEIGALNISFYRDDFTQIGLHPQVSASSLPFSVEGVNVILVDDVLMSGRTVRAAMNELFDYGRPSSIELAVLIDLDRRELPIAPTFTGTTLKLGSLERIKLQGPEPLTIEIQHL